MKYQSFVRQKSDSVQPVGFTPELPDSYQLMPHQSSLVEWACKRGRAAIFADTGLGKSRMQIAWANQVVMRTGGMVLILAPLAVAAQTVAEGAAIGVAVHQCRDESDLQDGINITNYDRLHRFDCSRFVGVVLDESSVIKHHDSKTLAVLLDAFGNTPYKLCATATPAPNDWTELGTHAEFLGVRKQVEMLAEFFVHDAAETQVWRLKGHARAMFWKWVASWGALVRSPADLGFDASRYVLPTLHAHQHVIEQEHCPESTGELFAREAQTLMDRRDARRNSLVDRVRACAELVNADSEPWIVWCDLNAESDALCAAIPGAVEVRGSDSPEVKERRLIDFADGRVRVLVSKPSICGFGLNWQHCARMAFVGVTDSWEAYYQAVRRCWRFGQKREVHVHVFASSAEGAVLANLARKEADAKAMADAMSKETLGAIQAEILGASKESNEYNPCRKIALPAFLRTMEAA